MILNEERREVAARLREKHGERQVTFEPQDMMMQALNRLNDLLNCLDCLPEKHDLFLDLADLIEPEERTCRKIRKNDPTHKGNWNFHCSRCNCYLRGTDEYCSNCGARVVEE